MPDLLNISKESVIAALVKELEESHRNLDFKAKQLRKDIMLAVEAIPQAQDPLKGAEVVASMDFPLSFDVQSGSQISLHIEGRHIGYVNIQSEIHKGKYRAFVFLHRVGDVEE